MPLGRAEFAFPVHVVKTATAVGRVTSAEKAANDGNKLRQGK